MISRRCKTCARVTRHAFLWRRADGETRDYGENEQQDRARLAFLISQLVANGVRVIPVPENFDLGDIGAIVLRDVSDGRFVIALSGRLRTDYQLVAFDDAVATMLNGPGAGVWREMELESIVFE